MECNYSITFEFETSQPITEKGSAKGTSVRTVAARAIDDATTKNPKLKWSSIVIVLERKDAEKEPEESFTEEKPLDNPPQDVVE